MLALSVVLTLSVGATVGFTSDRRHHRLLAVASICFAIVALVHVFEGLHLFQEAGWGEPRSIGHYVDLSAAVLGLIILLAAAGTAWTSRRASKEPTKG